MVNATAPVVPSSLTLRSAMLLMVGRSFTAVTVSTKLSLAVSAPSDTCTVMVAVPLWFAAGFTVTVRLPPEPPNVMFPTGTRVGLLELPDTVREVTAVSTSAMVNAKAPVLVSSAIDRLARSLRVGGCCGPDPGTV